MGIVKTTVEISDALLQEARRVAAREQITLRELVEQGLRRSLDERSQPRRFRLRRASFKGRGLRAEVSGSWERLRDQAYEGRGS